MTGADPGPSERVVAGVDGSAEAPVALRLRADTEHARARAASTITAWPDDDQVSLVLPPSDSRVEHPAAAGGVDRARR